MSEKKEPKTWDCTISPDLLASWKKFKRHGDTEKMAAELNVSYPVVQRAIKHGFVTIDGLSKAITSFFKTRLESESRAAQGLNDLADKNKSNGRAKTGRATKPKRK